MEQQTPSRAKGLLARGLYSIEKLLDIAFVHPQGWPARLINWLWIAGLLLYGTYLWGIFFNWGHISFDFLDWGEVTGPRYALLRDAAEQGVIPLHAENRTALREVTDRYFSIADTPFSPQYLLLPYLDTGHYIFYDTLLWYGAGFIGLLLLYRRYRLSPVSFSILFLLLNFNGNITGHLAVGHSIWVGQFLIPFFVLLVFDLLEKERVGWRWILGLSLTLLAILLQGHFHLWLWCLLFLGLLALFNWRLIRPVFFGGLFTWLVCLPRLLPPSLNLSGITQDFLGGFASLTGLVEALIVLKDPDTAVHPVTDTFPLNPWETDFYIGLLGFALVVGFGILLPLLRDRSKRSLSAQVLTAGLIFMVLSVGEIFARVVQVIPVPPLTGERVTSRMLILPLAFAIVLAAIFSQQMLERRRLPARGQILVLIGTGLLLHELTRHLHAWKIRYLDGLVYLYPKIPFDPAQHTIRNHSDPVYVGMLVGGSVVALLALVFLAWMAVKERQCGPPENKEPIPFSR